MIVLERNELMSTRMNGSEIALAEMTIERLSGNDAPHLLIGGYGHGVYAAGGVGDAWRESKNHRRRIDTRNHRMGAAGQWPMLPLAASMIRVLQLKMGDVGEAIAGANGRI